MDYFGNILNRWRIDVGLENGSASFKKISEFFFKVQKWFYNHTLLLFLSIITLILLIKYNIKIG